MKLCFVPHSVIEQKFLKTSCQQVVINVSIIKYRNFQYVRHTGIYATLLIRR